MRRSRRHKKKRSIFRWLIPSVFLVVLIIGGVYLASFLLGPPPIEKDKNTVFYSKDGEAIGEERGQGKRYFVPLDDISNDLIESTLVVEDKNFYTHHGFDVVRIGGAVLSDIQHLSLKEGASTLTQQYARNLYLSHEKTWTRKMKEAFYTIRLEMFYSKDRILEGYLNMIYYGHGAYGIEAASRHYFDKSASELSLAESAMLAGIPKGPSYYSPFNNLERAKARQKLILSLLKDEGYITEDAFNKAVNEQLVFNQQKEQNKEIVGSYFQDMVLHDAAKILNLDIGQVRSAGLHIYTTLDKEKQIALDEEVAETVSPDRDIEVGAIAMDPYTGEIEALVGGRNYEKSSFNRAVSAKRMPGSTFKPFLYYSALEHGYTANTMLVSKPTEFKLDSGKVYEPSNFNGNYADKPITLAQALALSDNIYAVKTNMFLTPERLVETAKRFGIHSKLPAVPSLALGTATVSVKEMVTGYGIIANGGKQIKPITIRKITDDHGNTLYEHEEKRGKQVLDRNKAFILTNLMTGMFDRTLDDYMSVTGASIAPSLTRDYAAKSGSTESDSWMIGYSPTLVTAVWTGYDDNRSMDNQEDMSYAKMIWSNFMERANQDETTKEFLVPAGLVPVEIDLVSGMRATPYCEQVKTMYFEKGTVPTEHCTLHLHGESPVEWFDEDSELEDLKKKRDKVKEPPVDHEEDEDKFFDHLRDWFRS